ncbi:MAG: hypothetical protein K2O61_01965 [Bacteroidaceae bacterium]|nr:hypothetical protein [Bacteroidaceae bacterium]
MTTEQRPSPIPHPLFHHPKIDVPDSDWSESGTSARRSRGLRFRGCFVASHAEAFDGTCLPLTHLLMVGEVFCPERMSGMEGGCLQCLLSTKGHSSGNFVSGRKITIHT